MLKKLFGSNIRINILKLFIFNPKQEYYGRQIERLIKEPFEPMRKELIRLESVGLLKSRVSGRQKYYCVNTGHALFEDFKSIILKTVGMADALKEAVKDKGGIGAAFIYGSYAKNSEDTESDIDLFVIGDIPPKKLQAVVSEIEAQSKREISAVIYPANELREKYKAGNHFIVSVLAGPKLFLKGDEHGLRSLVSGRKAH